jgi:hypothetical protein
VRTLGCPLPQGEALRRCALDRGPPQGEGKDAQQRVQGSRAKAALDHHLLPQQPNVSAHHRPGRRPGRRVLLLAGLQLPRGSRIVPGSLEERRPGGEKKLACQGDDGGRASLCSSGTMCKRTAGSIRLTTVVAGRGGVDDAPSVGRSPRALRSRNCSWQGPGRQQEKS